MPISVVCPACSAKLRAPEHLAGCTLPCPKCKTLVAVPPALTSPAPGKKTAPSQPRPPAPKHADPDELPPELAWGSPGTDADADADMADGQEDDPGAAAVPHSTPTRQTVALLAGGVLIGGLGVGLLVWAFSSAGKTTAPAPAAATGPPPPSGRPGPGPAVSPPRRPQFSVVEAGAVASYWKYPNPDRNYTGKTVNVRGVVFATRRDKANRLAVDLFNGSSEPNGPWVRCRMAPDQEEQASALQTGQTVTIRGRCDGEEEFPNVMPAPRWAARNTIVSDGRLLEVEQGPPPRPPSADWIDFPTPATHQKITFTIRSVEMRHLELFVWKGSRQGSVVRSRDKYLVFLLAVHNGLDRRYCYCHPEPYRTKLTDEHGNIFAPCTDEVWPWEVAADPASPLANESLFIRGQHGNLDVKPGQTGWDLIAFAPDQLGKGKWLLLEVDGEVFADDGGARASRTNVPSRVYFRLDQQVVQSNAGNTEAPSRPPASDPGPDKVTQARIDALLKDLNSESAAVRLKAAEGLAALGTQAKGASAALCYRLLYDQSREVRVTSLDALKAVNPALHQPVAVLAAPLTEVDLRFLASSGRGNAVAQIAALGPEGKAATVVLIAYKLQISQPGGWQHVPQVMEALVKVAPDDSTVTASLLQWLSRDLSPESRAAAATALAWMRDGKSGVGALAWAVRADRDERVRLAAVRALAALGRDARAAVPDLTAGKTDPSEKVREAARAALEQIQR